MESGHSPFSDGKTAVSLGLKRSASELNRTLFGKKGTPVLSFPPQLFLENEYKGISMTKENTENLSCRRD